MEVRAGYQQTEIGLIPIEWKLMTIGELGKKFLNGGTPSTAKTDYWIGTIPWITGADLVGQKVSEVRRYITKEAIKNSSTNLIGKGNLLIATRTGVGKMAIAPYDVAISQDLTGIYIDAAQTDVEYFFYYLDFHSTELRSLNQGTSIEGITRETLLETKVLVPPLVEQEAIAAALSDADALITALERLIAKKRQIKQGAMQELLTGKRRLPGFSGEWRTESLGGLGLTFGGLTGKTKSDFGQGDTCYITFMNIMSNVIIDCNSFELVNIKPSETQNQVRKGDLFFNGSSETPEEVGMCSVLMDDVENVFLNSFCFGFRFRADANVNELYFAYYFRSHEGRELLKSLAQGATRYNLSKTALLKLNFPLPKHAEQTAIAELLSDMDAEIEMLEAKLAKFRQVKQGMMQELLTGRIRLV